MSRPNSRTNTPPPTTFASRQQRSAQNIKVFARIRDFLPPNENADGLCLRPLSSSSLALEGGGKETIDRGLVVHVPGRGRFPFVFDQCMWSISSLLGQHPTDDCTPASLSAKEMELSSMLMKDVTYCDQEEVFRLIGKPMLEKCVEGYNACVLAYGATGSGKTYSVFGPPNSVEKASRGLIPRVCDALFDYIHFHVPPECAPELSVSMIEVYLECVYDLLAHRRELQVKSDANHLFAVVGAKRHCVRDYEEVKALLKLAESQRTVAATAIHSRSSRAHTIFQLEFAYRRQDDGKVQTSRIALVDLAGCERIKDAKTDSGVALDEACSINLSLLTLGSCIEAVVNRAKNGAAVSGSGDNHKAHASEFRSSTLTKILKDYITGNSLTTMLVTVSPSLVDANNTIQALRFADRAKRLQTVAKVNLSDSFVSSSSASGASQRQKPVVTVPPPASPPTVTIPSEYSASRQQELQRRISAVLGEYDAEVALEDAQQAVLRLEDKVNAIVEGREQMAASTSVGHHGRLVSFADLEDDDELRRRQEELLLASDRRDECEKRLEAIRVEVYPREFALRDQLENEREHNDYIRDQYEMDIAMLKVRVHELEAARSNNHLHHPSTTEHLERNVLRLTQLLAVKEEEIQALKGDNRDKAQALAAQDERLGAVTERLEAEKEQISLHYQLLQAQHNAEAEQQLKEREAASTDKEHQLREDSKRLTIKLISLKQLLDVERCTCAQYRTLLQSVYKTVDAYLSAIELEVVGQGENGDRNGGSSMCRKFAFACREISNVEAESRVIATTQRSRALEREAEDMKVQAAHAYRILGAMLK